jgi:hypothetical protein
MFTATQISVRRIYKGNPTPYRFDAMTMQEAEEKAAEMAEAGGGIPIVRICWRQRPEVVAAPAEAILIEEARIRDPLNAGGTRIFE